jgi:hypothetical protein
MESTSIDEEASLDRPARVEAAIGKAMELVRMYSERDPYDGDAENPWTNPQAMLEKLELARKDIVAARETRDPSDGSRDNLIDDNEFRAAYIDMVTNAFADVLEDMRNNGEEDLDVDILVDCLQSGMDFMSGEDKELFLMDDDDEIFEDGTPTPHEQRRLQLGLPTTVC